VTMKPEMIRKYTQMVRSVCQKHGMEPLITLTSISSRCFDSTVPLLFNTGDQDETDRARKCYEELFDLGRSMGLLPYRVSINHMDKVINPDSAYWKMVAAIKKSIDPNNIISPGRYCPDSIN